MAGTQSPFVWCELMTSDVAAAKAFYVKVVGWSTQDVPMPGMTYTLLRVGDTQIGGLMALPKEASAAGMKPCWVGYVEVDDADTAAAKVKRLGGKILAAPMDIPNVGRFATVTDPQGAAFNLFKPAQSGQRVVSNEAGHIGWHELHTTESAEHSRYSLAIRVGRAVHVGVPCILLQEAQIDVRVLALVLGDLAGSDFENDGVSRGSILQVVAVLNPGLESGAVAGPENFLPGVGHQHDFSVEDVDEFIFGRMPMPLAGPASGR